MGGDAAAIAEGLSGSSGTAAGCDGGIAVAAVKACGFRLLGLPGLRLGGDAAAAVKACLVMRLPKKAAVVLLSCAPI